MDIQETIDSLRKMLEGVIAPGVEALRLRLDAMEKEVQENGRHIERLDGRIDRLTERVEEGFSRLDGRIDVMSNGLNARLDALTSAILNAKQPTYPDSILTRLEKLERDLQELRKG